MAHSGSTRSRPRSSRHQHEASTSVRSPSVRGAQTNDLRAELNRRRAGEDVRVSLERAHERQLNIEGRNLDQDFVAVAPQPPVGARFQTGVPFTGGLHRSRGSPPHGDLATQVPAAPTRKIRRYVKSVGIPAGVRHRYHSSRWKHRCDGDIFSCRFVWACPDMAHESCPRINLFMGRALRGSQRTSPALTNSTAWRPTSTR
jgi:hypothetical protein